MQEHLPCEMRRRSPSLRHDLTMCTSVPNFVHSCCKGCERADPKMYLDQHATKQGSSMPVSKTSIRGHFRVDAKGNASAKSIGQSRMPKWIQVLNEGSVQLVSTSLALRLPQQVEHLIGCDVRTCNCTVTNRRFSGSEREAVQHWFSSVHTSLPS